MSSARLVITGGGFPGTSYEVSDTETLIGRNPTTDVTLIDEGISREHAVISFDDGTYTIEDLQSTNGTKVNGHRIRSSELKPGDEVQIGGTVFVFEVD